MAASNEIQMVLSYSNSTALW